jgi:hypothetical protein
MPAALSVEWPQSSQTRSPHSHSYRRTVRPVRVSRIVRTMLVTEPHRWHWHCGSIGFVLGSARASMMRHKYPEIVQRVNPGELRRWNSHLAGALRVPLLDCRARLRWPRLDSARRAWRTALALSVASLAIISHSAGSVRSFSKCACISFMTIFPAGQHDVSAMRRRVAFRQHCLEKSMTCSFRPWAVIW